MHFAVERAQQYTALKVLSITNYQKVEPNHIYVLPPGKNVLIRKGILNLVEIAPDTKMHPIDFFLRSLAEDQGSNPKLNIDRIQMMQIIINLTRNSIEAMQENANQAPELIIQTINKDEFIEIHFRDNGPGINPDYQDKIFHTYFTTKAQGTGLGLTICRNLIEAYGGKLYIQKHNNVGAWFIFNLPKQ